MKQAIAELLSSKKVITAIAGVIATIAARKGLDLDIELCVAVAGVFAMLIGAQGAADQGKEAAQIHADSMAHGGEFDGGMDEDETPVDPPGRFL